MSEVRKKKTRNEIFGYKDRKQISQRVPFITTYSKNLNKTRAITYKLQSILDKDGDLQFLFQFMP